MASLAKVTKAKRNGRKAKRVIRRRKKEAAKIRKAERAGLLIFR